MNFNQEPAYQEFGTALKKFGLSKNQIIIYSELLRNGEGSKASVIHDRTGLHKTETYRLLRELEGMGLVNETFGYPIIYVAAPLPDAIEMLIKEGELKQTNKFSSLRAATIKMKELLSYHGIEQPVPKLFSNIIKGEMIYARANEFAKKEEKVCVTGSTKDIYRLYEFDFFSNLKGECRIVVPESSSQQVKKYLNEHVHLNTTKDKDLQHFILGDNEAILFVNNNMEKVKDLQAAWTNIPAFVKSHKKLFDLLYSA